MEKDSLSNQGFANWAKRDFVAFCKACEKYGRENLEAITSEVDGKTIDEVTAYSNVFWQRYREIAGRSFSLNKLQIMRKSFQISKKAKLSCAVCRIFKIF